MDISIYSYFSKSAVQELVQALSERTVPTSAFREADLSLCVIRSEVSESWEKSAIRAGIPWPMVLSPSQDSSEYPSPPRLTG